MRPIRQPTLRVSAALLSLGAALSSALAAPDGGTAPAKGTLAAKLELGKLSREEVPAGCACGVYGLESEPLVFDADRASRPVLRVDGKLYRLEPTRSNRPKAKPKKGDTFFEEYASGDLKVRLDRTVTFVCAPDDEVCEVTDYLVDVTLEQGGKKRTYRGLKGDCGC